jgi:hypothetical protein
MPLRRDAFGASEFSRRQQVVLMPNVTGFAASPEDVIIGKLWYYSIGESEKHLQDITNIWRLRTTLDVEYIQRWVNELNLSNAWNKLLDFAKR